MTASQADVAAAPTMGCNRRTERLTLRQLRERRELSIKGLELLTGISRGTLSQIETGSRLPSPRVLHQLAEFYGVEAATATFVVLATFEVES